MSDHLGDTNKMVSDTPRTDAHIDGLRRDPEVSGCDRTLNFCRQLERELNAASKERDDALMMLGMYRMKSDEQKQRIKRLEEAGDRMRLYCADPDDCFAWDKARKDNP